MNRAKKTVLAVTVFAVVIGLGAFFFLRDSGPPRITLKQFELIQIGMAFDDVTFVLGREGKQIPAHPDNPLRFYNWDNDEGEGGCVVTFRNGLVYAKGQKDLR